MTGPRHSEGSHTPCGVCSCERVRVRVLLNVRVFVRTCVKLWARAGGSMTGPEHSKGALGRGCQPEGSGTRDKRPDSTGGELSYPCVCVRGVFTYRGAVYGWGWGRGAGDGDGGSRGSVGRVLVRLQCTGRTSLGPCIDSEPVWGRSLLHMSLLHLVLDLVLTFGFALGFARCRLPSTLITPFRTFLDLTRCPSRQSSGNVTVVNGRELKFTVGVTNGKRA